MCICICVKERRLNEIKVGPIVYEIISAADLRSSDGSRCFALAEHADCQIRLDVATPDTMIPVTYWHEALHIILLMAGRFEASNDEGLVECLANGIVGVLKDNPGMRCSE